MRRIGSLCESCLDDHRGRAIAIVRAVAEHHQVTVAKMWRLPRRKHDGYQPARWLAIWMCRRLTLLSTAEISEILKIHKPNLLLVLGRMRERDLDAEYVEKAGPVLLEIGEKWATDAREHLRELVLGNAAFDIESDQTD